MQRLPSATGLSTQWWRKLFNCSCVSFSFIKILVCAMRCSVISTELNGHDVSLELIGPLLERYYKTYKVNMTNRCKFQTAPCFTTNLSVTFVLFLNHYSAVASALYARSLKIFNNSRSETHKHITT